MITTEHLPVGYKPYNNIKFCSNNIIGGGYLFAIGNILPLLIGRGPKPVIWLQAIASPNSKEFITIVDASISTHPAVHIKESKNNVNVVIDCKTILSVEATSEQDAIISELDLRPIGLNLHGNNSILHVGGMRISNSTFNGVGTAFAIGA